MPCAPGCWAYRRARGRAISKTRSPCSTGCGHCWVAMSLKAQRAGCEIARNRHYNAVSLQRQRLLSVTAVIGGSVTAGFGVMQLIFSESFGYLGFVNLGTAALQTIATASTPAAMALMMNPTVMNH